MAIRKSELYSSSPFGTGSACAGYNLPGSGMGSLPCHKAFSTPEESNVYRNECTHAGFDSGRGRMFIEMNVHMQDSTPAGVV